MSNGEIKKEIDLMEYWRVILKRKWIIVTFVGALLSFTAFFSFRATPMYKSTATLLMEEGTSKILNIDETLGYQSLRYDSRFFNTQLRLLKSKSLAERVARKMNILSRPEFRSGKKRMSLISSVKYLITFKWISPKKRTKDKARDKQSRPLFPSNPYSVIANAVRNDIKVKPIRDTKLVEVSYVSPFPVLSAEIVNALAEEFIGFSIEKRYERTQQASDFLSAQISTVRED